MSLGSLDTAAGVDLARLASETRWETGLFTESAERHAALAERISARAAYQLALYARGVIVDIRAGADRRAEGAVHPRLNPVTLSHEQVLRWAAQPWSAAHGGLSTHPRLILLTQDGSESADAAAALRRAGFARATDVLDGFRGWCAAGLPIAP